MNSLPRPSELGAALDRLKDLISKGETEQAQELSQTIFESYALSRDEFLRMEDFNIELRNRVAELEDSSRNLEKSLKSTVQTYREGVQVFQKFCDASNMVNRLKDLNEVPKLLERICGILGLERCAIVLDRSVCTDFPDQPLPTAIFKGYMRYIDSTLREGDSRFYIGPVSRMMRPDIFFADPEMTPEAGGSCFSYGLQDKFYPGRLIGLFSIHDSNPDRYHPDMATDYLEHFCRTLSSALQDVINHQRAVRLREDVERITRHDLKTPLNAVINLPHLLSSDENDPERKEILKMIQEAGYKMTKLINRSHDIFRMEAGTYELEPSEVDLVKQLGRIRTDLGDILLRKDSGLLVKIEGEAVKPGEEFNIKGEELLLFSMFGNLIKNAAEATPNGDPISVDLSRKENKVYMEVHNSGAVPEDVRTNFFSKYSTSGKKHGSGLGTYSARLIAGVHGGKVRMKTSEVKGTTVTVELPESGRAQN